MNIGGEVINILKPIITNNDPDTPKPPNIVSNSYTGKSTMYATFNYADDRAIEFADNIPQTDLASIQIHLFAPSTVNIESKIKLIRSQLFGADFTYPQITRLYESETKLNHIVFECETIGNSDI